MLKKRDYLLMFLGILWSASALAEPAKFPEAELDKLYQEGKCLIEGCKGQEKAPEKGRKLIEQASKQSHGAAQFYLGSLEYNNDNKPRAILLYRAAANNGNADGQTAMGLYHIERGMQLSYQPNEQRIHYQEAIRWLKKAAEQKHAEAMFWYGDMLTKGLGISQDMDKGRNYLLQAAKAGNMSALAMVSYYLALGEMGFKKNPELAYAYGYKAVRKGNENAQNILSFSAKQLSKEQQDTIRSRIDSELNANSPS